MIVCHCSAVRERTIVKAIRAGATTLDELRADTGVARHCRGCEPAVLDLLDRHAAEQPVTVGARQLGWLA